MQCGVLHNPSLSPISLKKMYLWFWGMKPPHVVLMKKEIKIHRQKIAISLNLIALCVIKKREREILPSLHHEIILKQDKYILCYMYTSITGT